MVSDGDRGIGLEMSLSKLLFSPAARHVQIIGMSATSAFLWRGVVFGCCDLGAARFCFVAVRQSVFCCANLGRCGAMPHTLVSLQKQPQPSQWAAWRRFAPGYGQSCS